MNLGGGRGCVTKIGLCGPNASQLRCHLVRSNPCDVIGTNQAVLQLD
ncbi:MAG: hypothetical protein JWL59_1392 [Chthoniobacteraceae bacterium]|nr:hypothetical protein [Chthoniobacteraceae bacterium]